MRNIFENLKKGQNLSLEESKSLFGDLMEGKYDENSIIEILESFIKKGETKDELAGGIFVLRDKAYKVYCKTGKVSVSVQDEEIVITPNMLAEFQAKLIVKEHVSETEALAWQSNYFFFANKKIRAVFNEIERRYSVTINTNSINEEVYYSGSFEQFEQPDATIEIIGLTLGYQIIKESDSHYIVSAK